MPAGLYLDTSAILRAVLETGTTPDVEQRIRETPVLITSRLARVEGSRALLRLRLSGGLGEAHLADVERELAALWQRCELWEITPAVCEMACHITPGMPLRALDAIHLATYVLARRRIPGLELLTVDQRLLEAAGL